MVCVPPGNPGSTTEEIVMMRTSIVTPLGGTCLKGLSFKSVHRSSEAQKEIHGPWCCARITSAGHVAQKVHFLWVAQSESAF